MTRVHVVQHVPFEPGARIAAEAARYGPVTTTRVFAGDSFPLSKDFDALVVMGGPMGVHDDAVHAWLADEKRFLVGALHDGKPVLGVCLGAQLLAHVLGARVYRNPHKEIGWFDVTALPVSRANAAGGVPERLRVFHWHGDTFELPRGAVNLMRSEACENQWFALGASVQGIQFHLEVSMETVRGMLDAGADDLTPGPFVQSRDELLSGGAHLPAAHALLDRTLETWLAR